MITLDGLALAPGVAFGIGVRLDAPMLPDGAARADDTRTAGEQFSAACRAAESELRQLLHAIGQENRDAREILRAHVVLVTDPLLTAAVHAGIDDGLSAAAALERAASGLAARFEAFTNPVLRSRAADLRDVCACIARNLPGLAVARPPSSESRVICATDLSPAQVAQAGLARPLAFVLERGTDTSHAAILMRALGVPTVIQVTGLTTLVREGEPIVVDGDRGRVILNPDDRAIRFTSVESAGRPLDQDVEPVLTRDGIAIAVTASIGDASDARRAVAAGADGIGLFRTEWLFVSGEAAPTQDEQLAVYEEVAAVVGARPLTLRTFDLGSDKQAPGLKLSPERNPALGLRGIRLSFARPDLLRAQLRAVWRACRGRRHSVRLLLPMVTDVADVARMRAALDEAMAEESPAVGARSFAVGVMIETPAAAMMADELAAVADFFSVGTNDLTQYVLAADRENPAVAAEYQPLHPAVLRLVHRAMLAAARHGKTVAVCGEAAGDPLAAPLFVGMGAAELTVNPSAVPHIKRLLRTISAAEARALSIDVMGLPTAAAVLERLRSAQGAHPQNDVRATGPAR